MTKNMKTDRAHAGMSRRGGLALLALCGLAAGCAAPSGPAADKAVYEAPETVTGSMLKRSNNKAPTDPAEIEQARREAQQQKAVGIDKGGMSR